MYAVEKSDEAVVPTKRPNKERQLPAEVAEGRASPEGNRVRTLSRDATSIRLAAVRRTARSQAAYEPTFDLREEICAGGAQ
jgi:hypothetical protein